MTTICLGWKEVHLAASVGLMRQIQNLRAGVRDAHGFDPDDTARGWGVHVDGAVAELAVAKYLGRFWAGAGFDSASLGSAAEDVLGNLHVRYCARATGRLLLHKSDPDDGKFVLVVGKLPELCLPGWIYGSEAKQEKNWGDKGRTKRPCFWIDQTDLRPIGTLVA